MLKSFIEWILIISGLITAGSGVVALLFSLIFNYYQRTKLEHPASIAVFFVRHWTARGFVVKAVSSSIAPMPPQFASRS